MPTTLLLGSLPDFLTFLRPCDEPCSKDHVTKQLETHITLLLESNERTPICIFGEVIMNGERKYGRTADVAFVS